MVTELERDELGLAALPEEVLRLCAAVHAPPRLIAHLTLVHDVELRLLDRLQDAFPMLQIPRQEALFGAAVHDIGKALVLDELSERGHRHEDAGRLLLLEHGVPERMARFAVTHADLGHPEAGFADALVALADCCWKGKRDDAVEGAVRDQIAALAHAERWAVHASLDEIVSELAELADARLEWQRRFHVR